MISKILSAIAKDTGHSNLKNVNNNILPNRVMKVAMILIILLMRLKVNLIKTPFRYTLMIILERRMKV